MKLANLVLVAACGLGLGACSPEPATPSDAATLADDAGATMTRFLNTDPSLERVLEGAAGYAVFPDVGKAGLIAGGAYGRGEVYERGRMIGYADMTQATVGLQAGAQTYDQLIVFQDPGALDRFKAGTFTFAANASAVAIKPGAAAATTFQDGVAVFTRTKGGAMAEAAIGGQRFQFRPL